eukprot:4667202-Amphidinium_carterae.2
MMWPGPKRAGKTATLEGLGTPEDRAPMPAMRGLGASSRGYVVGAARRDVLESPSRAGSASGLLAHHVQRGNRALWRSSCHRPQ